jgi:hypothetical protein
MDGSHRRLVHNYPSGDPTPSRADIQMTQAIIEVAKPLGISVHATSSSAARELQGAEVNLRAVTFGPCFALAPHSTVLNRRVPQQWRALLFVRPRRVDNTVKRATSSSPVHRGG